MSDDAKPKPLDRLLDGPDIADALRSDRFQQFLDHMPIAIAVSELRPSERVTYANLEFERLTGRSASEIEGRPWIEVPPIGAFAARLEEPDVGEDDYVGRTEIAGDAGEPLPLDVWANVIQDDDGAPLFRVVAAAEASPSELEERDEYDRLIREKDVLMRELQHRVTNNLQMITTLIRLEARNLPPETPVEPFARLAGRVASLAVLYRLLSEDAGREGIDLGAYLTQIASSVMQSNSTEGIRLDLSVDSWPVSVNVAMPTGLVVNELLTNSLKHAFVDKEGGTITVRSLVDDDGCTVIVADNGRGFADGEYWPQKGKLGYLIAQSLKENADADMQVTSTPDEGTRVTIRFSRAAAAPADD